MSPFSRKVSGPPRKSRLEAGRRFAATVVEMKRPSCVRPAGFRPHLLTLVLAIFLAVAAIPDVAAAQVTPLGEEQADDPPGLGSIIGSPEAGPKPEDAGDRGGWAQLFLAVVLFGGVGFLLTRIFGAAARGADSS